MAAVLIYIDDERIDQEKEALDDAVSFFQDLYNAFKAIGLTVTMNEMANLSQVVCPNHQWHPERLASFVKSKLLDKAGTPDFNGVQFNRSLLEAHLALPDLSGLETTLKDYQATRIGTGSGATIGLRVNLIDFAADIFSKKADADTTLEAEFSYYTKTDKGAVLAGHLNSICSALNNFAAVYPVGQYGKGWGLHFGDGAPIPGITVRKDTFIPDLDFIRRRE